MRGQDVFKFAVKASSTDISKLLDDNVSHQAAETVTAQLATAPFEVAVMTAEPLP